MRRRFRRFIDGQVVQNLSDWFVPKTAINSFAGDELDSVGSFFELVRSVQSPRAHECRFLHAPRDHAKSLGNPLVPGRNLFGPGRTAGLETIMHNVIEMNAVSSFALRNVIISPRSTLVQSIERGLLDASIHNVRANFGPTALASLEPLLYRLGRDGKIYYKRNPMSLPRVRTIAVPICGSGINNYGHFLYDGLPAVLQYVHAMPERSWRIVGPELASWQKEILSALSCLDRYLEITQATRFDMALVTDMLSMHLSYPTRFIRAVLDTARFVIGSPSAGPRNRQIFLSRALQRRRLVNRPEVEDALRSEGIDVIQPERLSVAEQVSIAASSRLVIGESGAAMANVGFCDPGALILEIQPERFFDGFVRATCFLCGLDWHVYFAKNTMAVDDGSDPSSDSYHVDVPSLTAAIRVIREKL